MGRGFAPKKGRHPAYKKWGHIVERCERINHRDYARYGGRGIVVEEPWRSNPKTFIQWFEANCGGDYSLQVDRRDNDGNYSPDNCRLITQLENARNRRDNKILEAFGESAPLSVLVEKFGRVKYATTLARISAGWPVERALIELPNKKTQNTPRQELLKQTWYRIQSRCYNSNDPSFQRYGSRGIYVQWNFIEDFLGWPGHMDFSPGKHLDRIDNDGPYSPGNCRWVSAMANANNRSTNRQIIFQNEKMTLSEAVRRYGAVSYSTVAHRIDRGWTLEQALLIPGQKKPLYIR